MIFSYILFQCLGIILGKLKVTFPLDHQLPNVARTNKIYNFKILSRTFTINDTSTRIKYLATNLPKWLFFDQNTNTFVGKPSIGDIGEFEINFIGIDPIKNDRLSIKYKFLVSNDPGIEYVSKNEILRQIYRYGYSNGLDGLVFKVHQSFMIKISKSIFRMNGQSKNTIVEYYGRLCDRSALPNWIQFDANNLIFHGTVPSIFSTSLSSVEFCLTIIATDYPGFSGTEIKFKIIVGLHSFGLNLKKSLLISGKEDELFKLVIPIQNIVFIDDYNVNLEQIKFKKPNNLPSYVFFDQNTYTLSGKHPKKLSYDVFYILLQDKNENMIQIPITIQTGNFYSFNLPVVRLIAGKSFHFKLTLPIDNETRDVMIYPILPPISWIYFDKKKLTFSGHVPKNFTGLDVPLIMSLNEKKIHKTLKFVVNTNENYHGNLVDPEMISTKDDKSNHENDKESFFFINFNKFDIFHKAIFFGILVALAAVSLIFITLLILKKLKNKHDDVSLSPFCDSDEKLTKDLSIDGPHSTDIELFNDQEAALSSLLALKLIKSDKLNQNNSFYNKIESLNILSETLTKYFITKKYPDDFGDNDSTTTSINSYENSFNSLTNTKKKNFESN